jgi:hypothetical protein
LSLGLAPDTHVYSFDPEHALDLSVLGGPLIKIKDSIVALIKQKSDNNVDLEVIFSIKCTKMAFSYFFNICALLNEYLLKTELGIQ